MRLLLITLFLLLTACARSSPRTGAPAQTVQPPVTLTPVPSPSHTPSPTSPAVVSLPSSQPEATTAVAPTVPSTPPGLPEEAILILEPGPGSRLIHPVRVFGIAGPIAEQGLTVRILSADGGELAIVPAQIQAEPGERGPFSVDLPVAVVEDEIPAFIQVYTTSPRDGGITHLASASVRIASYGGRQIRPLPTQLERIAIFQPGPGATLSGGVVQVLGVGLASFEQTLVVDVLDQDGRIVGSQALIVNSSEPGKPGPFRVEVLYSVPAAGPGRVVVRDPIPAFDGDHHLSSVEVIINP